MAKKQSSDKMSTLAAKVLAGQKATPTQARKLTGSVLAQDERKGPRGGSKSGGKKGR